jgi:hypothetical protein
LDWIWIREFLIDIHPLRTLGSALYAGKDPSDEFLMDEIDSSNGGLVLLIVSWGREKTVAGYMHGLRPFDKVKDSLITTNNLALSEVYHTRSKSLPIGDRARMLSIRMIGALTQLFM